MRALRCAGRGSAPDLAGMRYEHLRVLIEGDDAWDLFVCTAQDFARAEAPASVLQALRLGRMTALQKDNSQVRGASSLGRSSAGWSARPWPLSLVMTSSSAQRLSSCSADKSGRRRARARTPTPHRLGPRRGGGQLRRGGAFDHVKRSAFFDKLLACEELRPLLPLVSAL